MALATQLLIFASPFLLWLLPELLVDPELGLLDSAKFAAKPAALALVAMCVAWLPQGLIARPCAWAYKAVQGVCVVYFLFVVVACWLTKEQTQTFLQQWVDGRLGVPLPERSYAQGCEVLSQEGGLLLGNIWDKLDVFVFAHLIGWFVKMFIVRDWRLATILSVAFQLMEVTFRHWLPNFYECWWDHVLIDLVLCNSGGMLLAYWVMQYFQVEFFQWEGGSPCANDSLAEEQRPTWGRLAGVLYFGLFFLLCDLSLFFNKFVLRIPADFWLTGHRTLFSGLLAVSAAKEYYYFLSQPSEKRIRSNIYLIELIIFSEAVLFARNYAGEFTAPFPGPVVGVWALIVPLSLVLCHRLTAGPKQMPY